jgi:hypothetical protein
MPANSAIGRSPLLVPRRQRTSDQRRPAPPGARCIRLVCGPRRCRITGRAPSEPRRPMRHRGTPRGHQDRQRSRSLPERTRAAVTPRSPFAKSYSARIVSRSASPSPVLLEQPRRALSAPPVGLTTTAARHHTRACRVVRRLSPLRSSFCRCSRPRIGWRRHSSSRARPSGARHSPSMTSRRRCGR